MRTAGGSFRLDVDVRGGAMVADGVIFAVIHLAAHAADTFPVITAEFLVHFDHLASSITKGRVNIHVSICHWRPSSVLWDG